MKNTLLTSVLILAPGYLALEGKNCTLCNTIVLQYLQCMTNIKGEHSKLQIASSDYTLKGISSKTDTILLYYMIGIPFTQTCSAKTQNFIEETFCYEF